MKTKKIIIIMLVVCLLGGLLTFNGSAAPSWTWGAGAALYDFAAYNWNTIIDYFRGKIPSSVVDLENSFKVLVTSPARVWTTTNCVFVPYSDLINLQSTFTSIGIHSVLSFQTDKNGVVCVFLKVTKVDDDSFSDVVGKVICINSKYAAAYNDNSTLIGGSRGGGGISGGGGGGRRGNGYMNDFDSDDDANNAYVDVETITGNEDIKDNTGDIIIYNNYDNSKTEVNNIINFESKTIYNITEENTYVFETVEYNGDTLSYDITYTNNNITEEMHIAYYVNYTVVNYVGLEDTYVLYYELPDGRNSYDMTVDELAQYSDSFDVINYAASADNDDLLALFPFNGNQENIAYNGSNLSWSTGNSITYQESEGFGAALYLGNSDHTFSFGGGTLDATGASTQKFTISFRYYYNPWQGVTSVYYPLTVTWQGIGFSYDGYNNAFKIGTSFNNTTGAPNTNFSSSYRTSLPTGQWSNITIQYAVDYYYMQVTCYVFVNGIRVGSYSTPSGFSINASTQSIFKVRNGTTAYSYLDELIVFKDIYYGSSVSANFTPSLQPYDTNLILTLPSLQAVTVDSYTENGKTYYYVYTPDQLWKPTIAVATDIPITQYYLGGVRPSLPKRGYVWVPILNNVIGIVQYYDGSGWQETGSRVWTGSRWVESSNYNIRTNGTYADLAERPSVAVISDEQGFWAWCVESFDTLITTIKNSGGGGGGVVADPDVIPDIVVPGVDDDGNETEDSFSLFDIVKDALGGVVKIIGKVIGLGGDVGSFFNDFADGIGDTFDVLNPNNQNGLFWVEVDE